MTEKLLDTLEMPTQTKFVGREKEVSTLKRYLDNCVQGNGNVVLVEGEIGIGKTRLIDELGDYAASVNVRFLKGKCIQHKGGKPYQPFIDALTNYFQTSETGEVVRKIIEESPPELIRFIPIMSALAQALGIVSEGLGKPSVLKTLQNERERMFEHITQLILRMSAEEPIVIFFDDLQWIDTTSLALLHYLAWSIRSAKILICGAYDEERLEPADKRKFVETIKLMIRENLITTLRLERPQKDDVIQILKNMLGQASIPGSLVEIIFEKTEGNPLFVEELLNTFVRDNSVTLKYGKLEFSVHRDIKVPNTLKEIVDKSLRGLDEESKTIAEYGAVIGSQFHYDILEKACGIDEETLVSQLDNLINAGVIYEAQHNGDESYAFKHTMAADMLYDEIPPDEKYLMHSKIARTYEELNQRNLDKVIYELARHYANSTEYEKATESTIKAGNKARDSYAPEEAIRYYELAIDCLGKKGDVQETKEKFINILSDLGRMYRVIGELDDALNCYNKAIKRCDELGNNKSKAEAYIHVGEIQSLRNDWETTINNLENGLEISRRIEYLQGMAYAYRDLGYVYWRTSQFDKALGYFNKTMEYGKKINDPLMIAYANLRLGTVYSEIGNQKLAIEFLHKSIEISEKFDGFFTLGTAHNNLGDVYRLNEDFDKAIEHYEKQVDIAKMIGYIRGIGYGLINKGECYAKKLKLKEAKSCCDKALEIFTKLGEKFMIASAYYKYGIIHRFEKDWDKSADYFGKSLKILQELKMPYDVGEVYYEFALMYEDKGYIEEAVLALEKAQKIFEKIGARGYLDKVDKKLEEIKV